MIVYFAVNCSGFFYNDMIIQCVCIAGDISAAIVPCSRQVVIHPSLPLKVAAAPRLSVTSSMKITRETMTTTAGLQCWSSAYGILHVVITATKYSMPFTFPSEGKKNGAASSHTRSISPVRSTAGVTVEAQNCTAV